MTSQAPVIELTNASVSIDGKKLISDLSWVVEKGENWVVVGPNGAGKTTLLRVINGYQWPTSGHAAILGDSFGEVDLRELRKGIGFVSSSITDWIPDDERVVDVVVSGRYASIKLWVQPKASDLTRARSLLTVMGCGGFARKEFGQLSQGERQRVVIARALMARPKLITLDEPCAGLDLSGRESFLSALSKTAVRHDPTMVYVTHRVDEIPRGFTHALLLKDGAALAQGPLEEVLNEENLTNCFGVKVKVTRWRKRYYAIVDA